MPVVSLPYEDLERLVGVPRELIIEKIPFLGADIERIEEDRLDVEFFPNRPDLYSVEGVARAIKGFLSIEEGAKYYRLYDSDVELNVDDKVIPIRPYIAVAIVKDVLFTESSIKSIMNLQEHLHKGLGRNRKKLAIGLHDLSKVSPPFTYTAVSPSFSFIPLDFDEEMSMQEVLSRHPKGIKYGSIFENFSLYPVILDSNDNVLSFPPIINAELTRVSEDTKNLFIDVTGTDPIVFKALNIVLSAIYERGCNLYSVCIKREGKNIKSPDMSYKEININIEEFRSLIGVDFTESTIIKSLKRLRYDAEIKDKMVHVKIPPYRTDILHSRDVIEDAAIGYGYDNIKSEFPITFSIGKSDDIEILSRKLSDVMVGLGFFEVMTFTLTNRDKEFSLMRREEIPGYIVLKNPISTEHTMLRGSLLPNLMEFLSYNKHRELPQKIFEIGDIVLDEKTLQNLAFVSMHSNAEFAEIRSYLDALFREIGIDVDLKESNDPAFLNGRRGDIFYKNKKIGVFGEFHPEVIWNFQLDHPTIGMEININNLTI
ncbi:MAG: phenylalanine--tRNA ligase subunit beta [Candidatus Methanoliparum thermophilum]|uniref:Phenylalanine--tRNA ligase beta subunit n=1 Tax=Methanoliparum thermophilum TaxID=2491083 RepID=A0A520KSP8_METT2|nr:phenylalanine--tRNA ligase subunit beta [Candidatus Methanoliparum sp. LAM-1]RZN64949.1 MAG: phenylalanine--tRNA ligase subunit beta [Candidatus Methanoliparum thermophilum]BDC36169.1 phenylalanine--tRNA ligase subunit beta [Candidatus Methanoliparum sp. LAM-1]